MVGAFYRKGPDGEPEIVEEEAEVVRDIYDMFISGKSTSAIAKILTEKNIPTPSGKKNWRRGTVLSILQNEKYKGSALLQKSFTTDFLTKKQKVNEGEVPQYYVEDSHPAIIDPRMWELTQIELERRGNNGRANSCNSIFSGRIYCGECGSLYGPRHWDTKSEGRRIVWRCSKKYGGGNSCDSPIITESDLKQKFVEALNVIYYDREVVLSRCRKLLEELTDTAALDEEIDEHLRECEIIAELNRHLVEENASRAMDQEEFTRKHDSYVEKYEKESARAEKLQQQKKDRIRKAELLSAFMFEIHEREDFIENFDEKLWLTTIESVVVQKNGTLVFRFRNGIEVTK